MLRKTVYPKFENAIKNTALFLHQKGFTPNQLTLAGLALNFVAGWLYAGGLFFLGAIVVMAAAFGDLLDGPLARETNNVTPFGAFLDSTIDRYSDFFIFGGLAIHFARTNQSGWFLLCMGILLGSFVISYSKARAENFIENCGIGFFGRAERIALLLLGTLVSILLPLILWVLFIGTQITAVQRILHTRKLLASDKAEPENSQTP